jgi:hypothetical protein
MPPAKVGKPLSEKEIELLKRWIEQGAPYAQHWAFVKPQRPTVPEVRDKTWPINPIDHFIMARQEKEGLRPTAEPNALLANPCFSRTVAERQKRLPPMTDHFFAAVRSCWPFFTIFPPLLTFRGEPLPW